MRRMPVSCSLSRTLAVTWPSGLERSIRVVHQVCRRLDLTRVMNHGVKV